MNITDKAQNKIAQLIIESQIATPGMKQFLRIAVQPGGCSGLRYQTYFDYEQRGGDVEYPFNSFNLVIDKMSNPYLQGSTLDYVESIDKIGFVIDNPMAQGSCACGDSFH